MRKSLTLLFILAVAGGAQAQEAEEREESRPEPTHRIKVLQHPYDIASFYRSSEERNYFGYQPLPEVASRYPIAGYYRSQQQNVPYGYGPFWGGGYGYGSRPSGLSIGYRQRIGERGELFLFFPTFLAPVGPLAGAFLEK